MKINKDHPLPIYFQLKNIIEKQIDEGLYHPGDVISSERVLSEQYEISRMTVRQAINELVKEGKLYREKGRGTFVSAPKFLQHNIKSFTETLAEQGYHPSTEVLEFSTVRNLQYISKMLEVENQEVFYKIKRLRLADATPVALETVYIPVKYCLGLDQHDLTKSLYKILKEEYDYVVESISCKMEAEISDKVMMNIFDVKKPIPLLKIEGVNQGDGGKKMFYETSYYRSDLYTYQVDLHRRGMERR